MVLKDCFIAYEEWVPEKKAELRRISLALRREGILTMEDLCAIQRASPEEIIKIRGIGEKSALLTQAICKQYEDCRLLIANGGGVIK